MSTSLTLRVLAVVCLTVACSWATPPSQASPTGTITGTVTADDSLKTPLAYANVIIVGTSLGAMALEDGRYTIRGVAPGTYTVKALMMGYKAAEKLCVVVTAGCETAVSFALAKFIACKTQEIVITADRPMADVTESKRGGSVSSEQLEEMPIDELLEAVKLKAGIVKSGDEMHVRGGRSGEVQYQIDGARVDDPLAPELAPEPAVVTTKRHKRPRKAKAVPKTAPAARPTPRPANHGTESYSEIIENEFRDALEHPVSTFSIDVDAASYSNIRRFLASGTLPPPNAVRVEEMINYFTYDYPDPDDKTPFTITGDAWTCPWNEENRLVRVALQGKRMRFEDLPPVNLVFLLDVSGSMDEPNKLPLVRQSMEMLIDHLRPDDRVAIVTYAGTACLLLDSTDGKDREKIRAAVRCLTASGSTAGAAGIQLAYRIAADNLRKDAINRIILATDGDFNVGTSSDSELVKLIERERDRGIFISILGFGTGNLKDSKLEQIADNGNGHYAYVDGLLEARRVFVEEAGATLYTIAKDVKIQIEFNPARVSAYRLIGYENRMLKRKDFDNDKRDAGDLGAGHSVTALYEVVPVVTERKTVRSSVGTRYVMVAIDPSALAKKELLTVKFRYKPVKKDESILLSQEVFDSESGIEEAPVDARFAAAVAEFGLILRGSRFKGTASVEQVVTLAQSSRGRDEHGLRAEFVRLVELAQPLLDTVSQVDPR